MARRLYFLDQARGAVMTSLPDGSGLAVLVENCPNPDGIVVDAEDGVVYWTNMGPTFDVANGSIERARLDGTERTVIVPTGATRTPKQLRVDKAAGQIYWCDREGMRLMRASLDGSAMETLVSTGDAETNRADSTRWCVGVALDLDRREVYWTQKGPTNGGRGRIFRTPMDTQAATERSIEQLIDRLPEPVDLELSADGGFLYWTDRARVTGGGSISRASIDPVTGALGEPERIAQGLDRPIGLALDMDENRIFASDLGGTLHVGAPDGNDWKPVLSGAGKFTGIALL
jgi:DNA-binding beta-propeller fold protein YncE